jgi:hypothetical protein
MVIASHRHEQVTHLEAEAWRGSTAATTLTRTNTDNMSVDSAGDAVVDLDIELWQSVLWRDGQTVKIGTGQYHHRLIDMFEQPL